MAKNTRVKEGLANAAASAEADHELQMARSQLYKIAQYSIKLHEMMKEVTDPNGIEAWQAAKITKAADYMGAVYHDLEYKIKFEQEGGELGAEAPGEIAVGETKKYGKMKETNDSYIRSLRGSLRSKINEKAVSQSQQQAAGAALAAKRGETPKSKLKGASKEMVDMSTKELEKIAGTKHKGLPDKKTNEAGRGPGQGRRGYNNNLPSAASQARKAQLKKQADKEKDKKTNEGRRTGMAAAGRASSSWGGMGRADRDSFKRREMEKELGHETQPKKQATSGPVYLMIDGRVWKKDGQPVEFKDKQHASNVGRKILSKNPGKDIKMTSNPNAK